MEISFNVSFNFVSTFLYILLGRNKNRSIEPMTEIRLYLNIINCYSNSNRILLLNVAIIMLFVLGIIHNDLKVAESFCVQNVPLYPLLSGKGEEKRKRNTFWILCPCTFVWARERNRERREGFGLGVSLKTWRVG